MKDHLEELDDVYFERGATWGDRLKGWIKERVKLGGFNPSHQGAIDLSVQSGHLDKREGSLRMVVNMGAHTLMEFIAQGRYLNGYERPSILGGDPPGEMRRRVDSAISDDPENLYFGAVTLNGTGVRFYGEYGVVLRTSSLADQTQIMDRNSWLAEFPPLKDPRAGEIQEDDVRRQTAERLLGVWKDDLLPIVKLKVLPQVGHPVRLPTTGVISEAVLQDESFVEVHKEGSFGSRDVHEVREAPQDASIESEAADREGRGLPLTPDEELWLKYRRQVGDTLHRAGLLRRIVATSGRERG